MRAEAKASTRDFGSERIRFPHRSVDGGRQGDLRLAHALPFSGEAAAGMVPRCYTRRSCGGIIRCNGLLVSRLAACYIVIHEARNIDT